ncbi:MAG: hypothetical protein ACW99G_19285 [Candidatus Thorarchaeota archaeon]|jgi:hypothetical protein
MLVAEILEKLIGTDSNRKVLVVVLPGAEEEPDGASYEIDGFSNGYIIDEELLHIFEPGCDAEAAFLSEHEPEEQILVIQI